MKRRIGMALLAVFMLLITTSIYFFIQTYQEKKRAKEKIEVLQFFSLTGVDGRVFTEKELPSNSWTVFVFFNSACHYCQSEAEQLNQLKSELDDITFLWVSSEPIEVIRHFQKTYDLEGIIFLYDEQDALAQAWGISTIPEFLIYTSEKHLFKNHKGALRMDRLIKQLHNAIPTH